MKIVSQSFEILDKIDGEAIIKKIEMCGRICYQSNPNDDIEITKKFVKNLIDRKHESVLEHVSISIKLITDRAIANEITRHRICSISQLSTRYVKFKELEVIDHGMLNNTDWHRNMLNCEQDYLKLIEDGYPPEMARDVLPLCTKTELAMTANLREWRHIFELRTSPYAHPQMRELMIPLLMEFNKQIPIVFEDIVENLQKTTNKEA